MKKTKPDLSKIKILVDGKKRSLVQRGEWYSIFVKDIEIVVAGKIWCILSVEDFWPRPLTEWHKASSQASALKQAIDFANDEYNTQLSIVEA